MRTFALNLSFHRIFGEEAKSLCSQGNTWAAITPSPLWSILVGRGPLCNVLFCTSKQKSGIIHFRIRMLKSPGTWAEQIRMHTFILHIRMKEISAGDKGGINQTLQWEKWDEETLLSAEENPVLFLPQVKFYQCHIYLINRLMARNFTSFCCVLDSCPFEDKSGCSEILQTALLLHRMTHPYRGNRN